MRIHDVVTPQELRTIFSKEIEEYRNCGKRNDLYDKKVKELSKRISDEYLKILTQSIPDMQSAIQMWRLLCLLDRFLEEKYANPNTN
jgi:hypothetical protein